MDVLIWDASSLTDIELLPLLEDNIPPQAPTPPRPSPPRAPHWSPQAGPSWMPHEYPYAPPLPPRQPSPPQISPPRQPSPPQPSPPRRQLDTLRVPSPSPPPSFDPESPEKSTRRTKGRTILEFNRPQPGQRPVQTPPSQGVAVYPTGPPVSGFEFSPFPMPERPITFQDRIAQRRRHRPPRPEYTIDEGAGTPRRPPGGLPRRRVIEEGMGAQAPRKRLFREFTGEEPAPPVPLSPPQQTRGARTSPVCPGRQPTEKIQIVEEFEETEDDFIPEHLRGFRWMDEPEDQFYDSFRQQFQG
ncbi:hypothetical protein HHI36_014527 [Cryptolaemus montrouzieri]|uniref:Uncharacterized protein n=1 Tax=Cryptolaemus montrouzieri TaxID=559131 RepID=A0ABD2N3S2_9CUCU